MTWRGDELVIAVSLNYRPSMVFRISRETHAIRGSFEMPRAATHTSGLAWDGQCIWAVDFSARRCYEVDAARSFSTGVAQIVATFDTGLDGTSACCFVTFNGAQVLAISQFRKDRQTVFVNHQEAINDGSAQRHKVFSYRNGGFSQGLEFDGKYLYESENRAGRSIINKIDLGLLTSTKDSFLSTVAQLDAPGWGVEDLAWDGQRLWTADEFSFRLYNSLIQ
jgi:hypothetical protein